MGFPRRGAARVPRRRGRCQWRCGSGDGSSGRGSAGQVGAIFENETDDVLERGVVAQFTVLVARDAVSLADGGEHLGLFDGVDAEIGFEIEIQVQHVARVAGLLDHHLQNLLPTAPPGSTGEATGAGGMASVATGCDATAALASAGV